jgi:hypothetical protein
MPTATGLPIPAAMLPAGPLNPYDWISINHNEAQGIQQTSLMRGTPGGMAAYQRKQMPQTPTVMQPGPFYLHQRPYSRGAGAYSPRFGVLNINPIGAGVDAPYKLPVIAGPAARYQFGAIWFEVQAIPTTVRMSPTMSQQSVQALLQTSSVAAMYATTG